jgi:NifU-like protein involved in Fe-S cluster formation
MKPCETAIAISALAAAIAEGKTLFELQMLTVIFTQIGDTLATIATQKANCEKQPAPSLE